MSKEPRKPAGEKQQPPVDADALVAKLQEQNELLVARIQEQNAAAIKDAVEASEIRLGQGFTAGINELKQTMGTAMIEEIINQVGTAQTALAQQQNKIAEAVVDKKIAQFAGGGGNGETPQGAPAGGGGLGAMLASAGGPQGIIDIINALRQPSTGQQVNEKFGDFVRGMSFGSKLKSGTFQPDDMEAVLGEIYNKKEGQK